MRREEEKGMTSMAIGDEFTFYRCPKCGKKRVRRIRFSLSDVELACSDCTHRWTQSTTWDADLIEVQKHLDSLDEAIPPDLILRQFRSWQGFCEMLSKDSLIFFQALKHGEGEVNCRVENSLSGNDGAEQLRLLKLAKHLYVSSFSRRETEELWSRFAPTNEGVQHHNRWSSCSSQTAIGGES
jgi:hypothetical protein